GDEDEYRATVNDFVAWCELNHLQLNVTKTKELVVDLRRDKAQVTPISIKGVSVDTVEDYKYLGVHIDNKLDWAKNTDALYRKGQSRLYFLRRLRSFNICRTMLRIFYESVVASAILYAVACWGSRLRVADANRLNKLIRKASDVVGVELDSLMAVSERRTLSKLQTIMDNGSHPLYHTVCPTPLLTHRCVWGPSTSWSPETWSGLLIFSEEILDLLEAVPGILSLAQEMGFVFLQVNDVNCENMSNDDAVRVLQEAVSKPGPGSATAHKRCHLLISDVMCGFLCKDVFHTRRLPLRQKPLSASKTDMATIVKEMQLPDSGLEIRDQMWLKTAIASANTN
ncbi:hypothetical protein NFI96_027262, partial [Prochilodus magdalenae]